MNTDSGLGSGTNQIWMKNICSSHKVVTIWLALVANLNFYVPYYIILFLLSLLSTYISFSTRMMFKGKNSHTYHFFIITLHLFGPVSAVNNLYHIISKREALKIIQCKMHLVCQRVQLVEISLKMQRLLLVCTVLQVVCYPTIIVVSYVFSYYFNLYPLFFIYHFIWCIYLFDLFNNTAEHSLVISILGQCYCKMRRTLAEFVEGSDCFVVTDLVKIHAELVDICKDINWHYTFRTVLIVGFIFCSFILQTFFTIDDHFSELDNILMMMQILAYFLLLLGIILLLIVSCAINELEADKFNEALASLCIRDGTGALVKNPYVMAHFAIGKKLKFSACGCFNIDYRLGYSMLAACITYLVILVEFDR